MTRSNGQGAHPAGLPPQRQQPGPAGAQPTLAGWPQPPPQQEPQQAWQNQQQPAPGWPAQSHYAQHGYAPQQPASAPVADPLGRAGDYHYPQTQQSHAPVDPYAQQRAAAPPQQQPVSAPQYAPQFDAYVPPSRPTAPPVQPPVAPGYTPQRPAHPLQQALQAGPPPRPELRGTTQEHWPSAPAPAPQPPQAYQHYQPAPPQQPAPQSAADPRGYDLGHYAPAASQQPQVQAYEPQLSRTYTEAPQREWSQHGATHTFADETHAGHYGATATAQQPSLDPAGYHNDQHGGYEATGSELTAEQDYAHDEEYEDDEPRRRSKGLIIVGALVGAIALGGGLAYAYKTFLAPSPKGKVPIVKNDKAPTKVAPVTPGGKQFANADAKVLNAGEGNKIGGRLNDGGPTGSAMSGGPVEEGVKRVQTVTVGRDGSIGAPPAANPLPGMVIADGGLGPRPLPPQAPQQPPQQIAIAPPQPAPEVKRIIAQPQAPALAPPSAPTARVAAAPPPPNVLSAKEAAAAASVSAPRKQIVPTRAPAAASTSVGVGSGYVAVLASQRSQMEALQTFADLKQKYPQLLQNRQPGVQEANLGEKGVYHRLLAGPAGSKEDAAALCTQLKASGHASCWVTSVK